jgi:hypothetical protein
MYTVDSSNNEQPGNIGKSTYTVILTIQTSLVIRHQSRDTGNICHTENRTKTKKEIKTQNTQHKTMQKTKMMDNTDRG